MLDRVMEQFELNIYDIRPPDDSQLFSIQNQFPGWPDFVERQFYDFAEDVKKVLDGRLYRQSIEKFENMKRDLPCADGPSFIHIWIFVQRI